jgi:tetratricopeptide (TPR) repeat protein
LVRSFAGGLDAITAKALRKEPQHRYVSAEQMAEDLRRHLAGRHVLAPHGTASLPWAEFLRLRRWWLTAGAVLTLLLLAAIGALVLQGLRLAEMRAMAERDQARTHEIVASMERVFEEAPVGHTQGREAASRDLLDHAARSFQQDLAGQPETQADLLMALGHAYFRMGLLEEAAASFQTALAIRQRLFGAEHEAVAESLTALSLVDLTQGDLEDAEDIQIKALAMRRKIHAGDNLAVAESLVELGRVNLADEHPAIAEPLLQEALVTRRKLLGEGDVRVAETLIDLGHAVGLLGSPSSAEYLFKQAATMQRRASGDETWELAINLVHQAAALFDQGKRKEGRELLLEASRIERQLCGDTSSDLASSLLNFAAAAARGTPWARPASNVRPTASGCRAPPLAVPHLTYLLRGLGADLSELGHEAEARPLLQQAGEIRRPASPALRAVPDSSQTAGACVPDGGFAEVLKTSCCSGVVVDGTTVCSNPEEWGGAWRDCRQVCGSRLVNGCVPPGAVDDVLEMTDCCSGVSVNNSFRCLNPADAYTTWRTCVHTCA